MAGYYDKNKDYSKELQRTDLSASERDRLTKERENKIADKYGGREPNMIGSDKTYSQTYDKGGNRRDTSSSGGSSQAATGGTPYIKGPGYGTGGYTTPGIYGAANLQPTDQANYWKKMTGGADMSRRPDLAGGYSISNGYTVFYDENGYAKKAVKGVADYTPHQDINAGNGSYGKSGAWTDNEMMSALDRSKIQDIRNRLQRGEITGGILDGVRGGNPVHDHGEDLTDVGGRVRLRIVLRVSHRRPHAGGVKRKSILTFHAQGELHVGVGLCGIVHSHVQFLPS